MKKEYFIGDRRKYGVTLMETVKLEERLPGREIFEVKWTGLTDYKGIYTQVFPMVRTDGEFYDFTPVSYEQVRKIIEKQINENKQTPLTPTRR